MNERIRELANQAHEYALGMYDTRIATEGQSNVLFYQIRDDKFAELIVRECISQIEEVKSIKAGNAGLVYTQGFDDGMFVAIRTIEEHFGVEE